MNKFIFSLLLVSFFTTAKQNQFGEYGYIDSMSYPVGQCFNNIHKIDDVIKGYNITVTFNTVKLTGKKTVAKDRCAVFVFNDAILGGAQDYYGNSHSTVWYIKHDGIHLYGVNNIYTAAMQYALSKVPHKKVLFLHDIPGSLDDTVNLQTINVVRKQAYNTILPDGASVASGGADFFLSGVKRAVEGSFNYGVHSWGNSHFQGADLPRNHPEHQMFIKLYKTIDIPEEFYWYTLKAAPVDKMFFMRRQEMMSFELINSSYKDALHH